MSEPYRKHGHWYYKVKLADGTWKAIRTHSATKVEARKLQRDHEVKIDRQRQGLEPVEVAKPIPTLAAFLPDYLRHKAAERRKPSTEAARESHLRNWILPILGAYHLNEIDLAAVDLLKEAMKDRARNSANNTLAVLSNVIRTAKLMKVIRDMPIAKFGLFKVDNAKPPTFYSEEELGRLVEAAIKIDPRVAAIVLLGADAGLRLGEIRALAPWDVKWDTRQIHVEHQLWRETMGTPKSGKGRVISMTDRLAWALRVLGRVKGEYLLLDDDGERYPIHRVQILVRQAKRAAGLRATKNVHILRHTFCTRLAMAGVPARVIQELAGHAHLTTTMRYMHVVTGAKEAAITALNRPLPSGLAPQGEPGKAVQDPAAAAPAQLRQEGQRA